MVQSFSVVGRSVELPWINVKELLCLRALALCVRKDACMTTASMTVRYKGNKKRLIIKVLNVQHRLQGAEQRTRQKVFVPTASSSGSEAANSNNDDDSKRASSGWKFTSRLTTPSKSYLEEVRQSHTIEGVSVPPRPEEPDNCCMS